MEEKIWVLQRKFLKIIYSKYMLDYKKDYHCSMACSQKQVQCVFVESGKLLVRVWNHDEARDCY